MQKLWATIEKKAIALFIACNNHTYIVHGPDMKTLPPPPLGIFEDSDFWTPCYMTIQYLLVCTQNIGAQKLLGH